MALALAIASGALQLLPDGVARLRYLPPGPALAEPWRLLTGQLVHLNGGHWAANAAALLVLAWFHAGLRTSAAGFAGAVLLSALAVGLGLWCCVPAVAWYAGLSGALHGLFAAGCVALAAGSGREHRLGLVLFAAGALKLAWESASGWPIHEASWLGLPTVPAAHVLGYAGGTLWGAARAGLLRLAAAAGAPEGQDGREQPDERDGIG